MKVTKKEINKKTRVKKGVGFCPVYTFSTDIKDLLFEKTHEDRVIYQNTKQEGDSLGFATTKKEYVNLIYDFLNR